MLSIRRYAVIVKHSPTDLVSTVTRAIEKGWHPIGGVAIAQEAANPRKGVVAAHIVYTQAMVLPHTANHAAGLIVKGEEDFDIEPKKEEPGKN